MDALEGLDVWRRSKPLAVKIYGNLAECRDYSYKDQITRASVSIASNIAEGYERNSKREFAHYLRIAKGSCAEVRTQVLIGEEIGFIPQQSAREIHRESLEISKMIQCLINHCHKALNKI